MGREDPITSKIEQTQIKLEEMRINDALVIKPIKGESVMALADRAKIDLSSFLKYNDISIDHTPLVGLYYFLEKKKSKSSNEFYKVEVAEDLWTISQLTGMQLKRLKKFNEFENDQVLPAGSVVWLNGPKPSTELMPNTEVVALIDEKDEFDWTGKPEKETVQSVEGDKNLQKPEAKDPISTDYVTLESKGLQLTQYTVKQGETLYSIAKTNNIEVMNLLAWNNLTLTDGLKPGQILKMTPPEDGAVGQSEGKVFTSKVHEVQASDTLYSIARKYSITIKELMEWNGKENLSLTVGEKLQIPQR